MTDTLTLRAEQALLAAALLDRRRLDDITYLSPTAFAHPTHQAIHAQLLASRMTAPDLSAELLFTAIADSVDSPGVTAAYLAALADACPAEPDIAVYARMVQEAAVRRDLATFADNLSVTEPRSRLSNALRQQAFVTANTLAQDAVPVPYVSEATPLSDAATRAYREERVLADLLQHPEMISEVTWLASDVFTAESSRRIYEAVVTVSERGEPVEELTIAWEVARQSTRGRQQPVSAPDDHSSALQAQQAEGYLTALFTVSVSVGVAVELGAELLSESLRTSLATEAVTEVRKPTPPTVEPAVTRHTEAGQRPPATHATSSPLQPPPPSPQTSTNPEIRP